MSAGHKILSWLCAVLALGCEAAVDTPSQQVDAPSQQMETYADWTVRCVERESLPPCDMVQLATERDSGEQVMQFSIAHAGRDNAYGVQIRVPLGVFLNGGAAIRVDAKAPLTGFAFTRCDAGGCYIERIMQPDELQPFKAGIAGVLGVIGANGQPMTMPLSFRGFSEALRVMTDRNRNWAASL